MEVSWVDLGLFIALLTICIYVFIVNNLTTIHKAYLAFHSLMMMWPVCQFFLYITPDQQFQWFFINFAFLGLCFLGYGWLIFSLALIQILNSIDRKILCLSSFPAVLCAVLITTNPWHYLFAQPVNGGWTVRTYGPFFWFFVFCSLVYLIVAFGLIFYTMKKLEKGYMKKQLSLCLWGIILLAVFCLSDVLVNVILFPGLVVPGLTSAGIILSALCFVTAIQKYDLFKIVSIAEHDAINSMDTGMIVLDKDDIVLNLNISAANFINHKPKQVLKIEDLLEYSQNKIAANNFLKEYHRSNRHYIKTELVFYKEQTAYISINVSPVFDRNKNLLGRVITINDVSELRELLNKINEKNEILEMQNEELLMVHKELAATNKTTEEMLRFSEERFSKAFYYSPHSLSLYYLDSGKFIDANESCLKMHGYSRDEFIGHSELDLNLWVDMDEHAKYLKDIKEKGFAHNHEVSNYKKSGEIFIALSSGVVIDLNGEQCVFVIKSDITELRQYQREISRLDRLNLISEMAAGIAHELRNPMTTVRGFLQILGRKERYIQDKEHFNLMIDELDRANSIITEFLSLAKNKVVDFKKQDLNTIINAIFPLIQADAMVTANYINIKLEKVPELLLDEKEIRQLILNLVRNALEAMPPDEYLTIKSYLDGSEVVLSIQDRGTGIPSDILDKLGTPFFTTKDNGTGLGLAICYSIANRHNAKIEIKTSSEGTTFYVRFKVST